MEPLDAMLHFQMFQALRISIANTHVFDIGMLLVDGDKPFTKIEADHGNADFFSGGHEVQ